MQNTYSVSALGKSITINEKSKTRTFKYGYWNVIETC
jgi:hypothetical protein